MRETYTDSVRLQLDLQTLELGQCSRTALSDGTSNVLFILDALEALDDAKLNAAADELSEELQKLSADVKVERRLVTSS
jgi:DNA/RNA-binding domain of Phe-tRNA-synthetase-like protein